MVASVVTFAVLAVGAYSGFAWFRSKPATEVSASDSPTVQEAATSAAADADEDEDEEKPAAQLGTVVRDGDFAFKVTKVSAAGRPWATDRA